ncbi:hypothetical protein GIB67_000898, partial [Kingdonia uniflora]
MASQKLVVLKVSSLFWSVAAMPRNIRATFFSEKLEELGDFTGELKLSFFQLGISPQIAASILMQVLCHVVPSLVKLRKEGLDGHEKIKSYIWWISLGFAILESVIVSCFSLSYSIYAASHRHEELCPYPHSSLITSPIPPLTLLRVPSQKQVGEQATCIGEKHVMVTTLLLVCGAMTMTWICDQISESGFGKLLCLLGKCIYPMRFLALLYSLCFLCRTCGWIIIFICSFVY